MLKYMGKLIMLLNKFLIETSKILCKKSYYNPNRICKILRPSQGDKLTCKSAVISFYRMFSVFQRSLLKNIISILIAVIFWGCPSTAPKVEKTVIAKPEITIRVASLSLTNLNKRIERRHISNLVKILKREGVEIFAVQGISRYPSLSTRIDIVNELTAQMEWRNAFGEMLNMSGRQTGNAVFSMYPILSQFNHLFDVVKSDYYESALQTVIDVGVGSVSIISSQLPEKVAVKEQEKCLNIITSLVENSRKGTIIAGNLPAIEKIQSLNTFAESINSETQKNTNTKIWYSTNTSFKHLNSYIADTELGSVVIVQFGIFR